MEEKKNVEIFADGTVIQLFDDENKPVDFYEIASIEYDGKFYELLQPVEPLEGIQEDEAVILEYVINEETDEKSFKPLFDENLLNRVFEEYLRELSDDECGCGCGCDECDCDDETCDCDDEHVCQDGECDCKHHHN